MGFIFVSSAFLKTYFIAGNAEITENTAFVSPRIENTIRVSPHTWQVASYPTEHTNAPHLGIQFIHGFFLGVSSYILSKTGFWVENVLPLLRELHSR